jgi:lipopolysaccharide/colanic/teichoic acid biosynthesis glycosyltransferase
MQLIIICKDKSSIADDANNLLRFAISSEPVANIIFDGLSTNSQLNGDTDLVIVVPEKWHVKSCATLPKIEHHNKNIALSHDYLQSMKRARWLTISNGRFLTQINRELLDKVLRGIEADVVAVNVSPELQAGQEKVLTNSQGKLVGVRRLYNDFAQPALIPADWPHHLFIKTGILNKLLVDDTLLLSFTKFIDNCFSNLLTVRSLDIGGTVLNLDTEEGLLGFLATKLNFSVKNHHNAKNKYQQKVLDRNGIKISPSARLFGTVLFQQNLNIGPDAVIVGPTIISNDAKIGKGAVIKASIVGPGVSVPQNCIVQNRVLFDGQQVWKKTRQAQTPAITENWSNSKNFRVNNFRTWPRFSYARSFKRIADIVAALIVLILFAPVFPIITLVIKLTSPGPVFFKDTRQGLHGKVFKCLKFRTMLVGSDKIQDKLRILNQADGPQFKMMDDPRLSTVGSFLRDTYIDEVPQFFNVLLGQMSIVGPRPSPESENTLCPFWRDARLSVRPGITGLWQVHRTRQPMKDFQEWIHYDTKYVRDLSLRMDLWVCWLTTKKLIKNFVSQF